MPPTSEVCCFLHNACINLRCRSTVHPDGCDDFARLHIVAVADASRHIDFAFEDEPIPSDQEDPRWVAVSVLCRIRVHGSTLLVNTFGVILVVVCLWCPSYKKARAMIRREIDLCFLRGDAVTILNGAPSTSAARTPLLCGKVDSAEGSRVIVKLDWVMADGKPVRMVAGAHDCVCPSVHALRASCCCKLVRSATMNLLIPCRKHVCAGHGICRARNSSTIKVNACNTRVSWHAPRLPANTVTQIPAARHSR